MKNKADHEIGYFILALMAVLVAVIVAYPLYYVLVAYVSNPYDVYAGKTFLKPSGLSQCFIFVPFL